MKALSIRQPWAWAIIHGGKDIENRSWPTKFRGRFLVHAAKGMTLRDYTNARAYCWKRSNVPMPAPHLLDLGGFIGTVDLVDCVTSSDSQWFLGPHGFQLARPEPLPFVPYKGRLGFFDVPDEVQP